jgi:aminopeptidase N
MLRSYLGDEAFFEGINRFLTNHKFGTAEAHNIRLAFEEICGQDLNWFFNQWFFGNGHIKLDISYDYNEVKKTVSVNVKQKDKKFVFPLSIDIYEGRGKVTRHEVWVDDFENTFTLDYIKTPQLVNVGAKRVLIAEINDQKSLEQLVYQYNNAPKYLDRKLAMVEIAKNQQQSNIAYKTLVKALKDPYDGIRIYALQQLDLFPKGKKKEAIKAVFKIAKSSEKTLVKAEAIKVLGKLVNPKYRPIFIQGLESDSHAVLGASLVSLYQIDKQAVLDEIVLLSSVAKESLANEISTIYIAENDQTQLAFIAKQVLSGMFLNSDKDIQEMYKKALGWISQSNDLNAIRTLTDDFVKLGLRYQKYKFDQIALKMMNQILEIQGNSKRVNKQEIQGVLRAGIGKLLKYQK